MVHFFNRRVLQYNFHRLYDFLTYIFGGLKIFTRTGFSCLVIFLVWYISQCGSHASIRSRNKQMMSQSSVKNTTEVNVLFIVFPIFTLNQVEYTLYFIWHGVWNKHILVQYLWNPFNVEDNHYNFSIAISLKRSCLEVSCYVMEIFILLPFDKEKSMRCSFLYLALLYYTMIAGIKQKYNLNSNFCFRLSFCT